MFIVWWDFGESVLGGGSPLKSLRPPKLGTWTLWNFGCSAGCGSHVSNQCRAAEAQQVADDL